MATLLLLSQFAFYSQNEFFYRIQAGLIERNGDHWDFWANNKFDYFVSFVNTGIIKNYYQSLCFIRVQPRSFLEDFSEEVNNFFWVYGAFYSHDAIKSIFPKSNINAHSKSVWHCVYKFWISSFTPAKEFKRTITKREFIYEHKLIVFQV